MSRPNRTCDQLGVCEAKSPACQQCKPLRLAPGVLVRMSRPTRLQRLVAWFAHLGGHR